jgi:hypothetical protein
MFIVSPFFKSIKVFFTWFFLSASFNGFVYTFSCFWVPETRWFYPSFWSSL